MKKVVLLSLIIALISGSCKQEKKSPIEGTWKMVYSSQPGTITQIKTWSKEYYTFVGFREYKTDAVYNADRFGAGTYTIDGNRCVQTTIYHVDKTRVGTKRRILIEFRNDTLIQKDPADENWELPQSYTTEKYVRLK